MKVNEQVLYRMVGERVRMARGRLTPKMSQASLADKLKVSRASVVNIEAGRQHPPLHVIWQIADALGVEPSSLMPSQSDYLEAAEPIRLDPSAIEQIEAAANGDPNKRRMLLQWVNRFTEELRSNEIQDGK